MTTFDKTKLPKAPLALEPHFSERPWGGERLRKKLGLNVPGDGGPYGEAWTLSDHPNGRSTIASGPLKGKTFGEALRAHPREMMGTESAPERYPLLVKAIDAAEDLSIQVHPDDAHAPDGDRGKTECWYVIDCDPGTEVVYGVDPDATVEDLKAGAADGSLADMMARFPIEPGTFLFVPAGTVHAILGGTLICEIQQSSDTTYRLWDWGREPKRELHLEQAWPVIDLFDSGRPPVQTPPLGSIAKPFLLVECEYFRVQAMDVPKGGSVDLAKILEPENGSVPLPEPEQSRGLILCTVAGDGVIEGPDGEAPLKLGGCVFLPACCEGVGKLRAGSKAPLRVLIAESLEG